MPLPKANIGSKCHEQLPTPLVTSTVTFSIAFGICGTNSGETEGRWNKWTFSGVDSQAEHCALDGLLRQRTSSAISNSRISPLLSAVVSCTEPENVNALYSPLPKSGSLDFWHFWNQQWLPRVPLISSYQLLHRDKTVALEWIASTWGFQSVHRVAMCWPRSLGKWQVSTHGLCESQDHK